MRLATSGWWGGRQKTAEQLVKADPSIAIRIDIRQTCRGKLSLTKRGGLDGGAPHWLTRLFGLSGGRHKTGAVRSFGQKRAGCQGHGDQGGYQGFHLCSPNLGLRLLKARWA